MSPIASSREEQSPVDPIVHCSKPSVRTGRFALFLDMAILGLVLALFFYGWLGGRALANPDEGRYAEIPREMLATHDFVTPHLNGVRYFEKPPLFYWLTALALKVGGPSEFAARFWCATFALGGALLVYFAAASLYDRLSGAWAAVVLATSVLYYALSRIVLLDLAVSVFIAATLFSFLLGFRSPAGARRRWLFWAGYVSMALATLTKGLIGIVFPLAIIGLWLLLLNQWRVLRPFHPWSGAALFLALTLPWHIAVARANPDFLGFYFVHEHLERFATRVHERVEPWWFFLAVLTAGFLPWSVFAFSALLSGWRQWWRDRAKHAEIWFLLIWIAFVTLFFTASQSKLATYIVPVFPPAAVLVGGYLARIWREKGAVGFRPALWILNVLFYLAAAGTVLAPLGSEYAQMSSQLHPWRIAASLALGMSAILMSIGLSRRQPRLALTGLAVPFAVFLLLVNPIAEIVDLNSAKSISEDLRQYLGESDDVFCVGGYFQDVPVYLGRLVSVVDYEGELAFGIESEPDLARDRFIDRDAFLSRWLEARPAYAIVAKEHLDQWPDLVRPGVFVLAQNSHFLALTNREPLHALAHNAHPLAESLELKPGVVFLHL